MSEDVILGDLIDSLQAAITERKRLEKESVKIGEHIKIIEHEIIKRLADAGLEKGTSHGTTVEPKREVFPHVENWDLFGEFIITNRFLHLLEKRPTVLAYRELLELGREVPGVVPFVKTRLSVRTS